MKGKGTLRVFDTPDIVSSEAANLIIRLARESITAHSRFIISLSGGNTPGNLYSLLATSAFKSQIEWNKTFVFWGDERCVSLDDKQNNSFIAKKLLLDKIDIPANNIYRVPVNLPPAEAAQVYEETIKNFFGESQPRFDLVLLGLGENGHTASLFPGTAVLHEREHWVKELYVNEQKMFRITMTASFINQARNIVFLVTGKEKADILQTVLNGSYQPEKYPAQLINPSDGKLYWFIDKSAARNLSHDIK